MNEKSKVLALKYRPKVFEELIGQKVASDTIINAIKADKVPNAYLFTGIRGVGKTTIARIVAKSLNCLNGIEKLCEKNLCINCDKYVLDTWCDWKPWNENEIEQHAKQLEKILDYIKQLEKINTQNIPCTTIAIEVPNVFRKDEKKDYENFEEIIDLAPARENTFFKVPKIINE